MVHVLIECRGLRVIWWFEFRVPRTLFRKLKSPLSRDELFVGMVVWWNVWEIRNNEIHGVEDKAPPDLVGWAREYLAVFHASQMKFTPVATEGLPSIWVPPHPEWVKINVDVAIPEGVDFIRVWMVAGNASGLTIWWARKEIVGRPQPSEGEVMAVVFGVHTAIQQAWPRVIIETDCLPVHRYLLRWHLFCIMYFIQFFIVFFC